MAGQTITNLGSGGSALNGRSGSTAGSDSNDPIFLDHTGTNYIYLPGVASNYLSIPDAAALDILGDIDVRIKVAMDDWTPAATVGLAFRSTFVDPNQSWKFTLLASGALSLSWYPTGSSASLISKSSSVAVGATDGDVAWLRVTLDVDNGAGGNDVKFYTSTDGVTWIQLGTTQTTAGVTSLPNVTSGAQFATSDSGWFAGKFYRAQVLSGIAGSSVVDINTTAITSGNTASFTATTGQTVTINRSTSGRKSVCVVSPCWLFGTDDYIEVADHALLNFSATDSFTVLAIYRDWNTMASNRAIVSKQASAGGVGWMINMQTNVLWTSVQVSDGTRTATAGANTPFAAGALVAHAGVLDRAAVLMKDYTNSALSGSSATNVAALTSLINALTVRVGQYPDTTSFGLDMELMAVAVFRRALTVTEITRITAYYQARMN